MERKRPKPIKRCGSAPEKVKRLNPLQYLCGKLYLLRMSWKSKYNDFVIASFAKKINGQFIGAHTDIQIEMSPDEIQRRNNQLNFKNPPSPIRRAGGAPKTPNYKPLSFLERRAAQSTEKLWNRAAKHQSPKMPRLLAEVIHKYLSYEQRSYWKILANLFTIEKHRNQIEDNLEDEFIEDGVIMRPLSANAYLYNEEDEFDELDELDLDLAELENDLATIWVVENWTENSQ